ncbi:MAG TPA: hypothetical protein VMI54_09240 [Polyangiaceae bacterium]|nr:hypothetical protein [Polyangiaceae bacterium]
MASVPAAFSSPRRNTSSRIARFAALLLVACSVDHHALSSGEPPPLTIIGAGAGAGATDATGNTGATSDGDDNGGAPAAGGDTSGPGGAPSDTPPATTAATSWTFDSDADTGDWQPDDGVDQSFSDADADGSEYSGSLVVTNGVFQKSDDFISLGTSACVPVVAGTTYDVAAAVEIDPGQGSGSGGFEVQFLDGDGCDGVLLDLVDYLTATTGTWEIGEKMPMAPASARSALFRLVASKRASDPPFAVHFDDVRFESQ